MVIRYHHCQIFLNLIASTESAPIAAMEHSEKPIYALQFHPEVTHTKEGNVVLENFIIKICNATPSWKMDGLIAQKIDQIKKQVVIKRFYLGFRVA